MTIAIFFIFQLAAFNFGFTGGTSGILLPIAPFSAANYNQPFYYVALVILILTVIVSWAVRRSRFGLQLLAIRDDEDRALGLGVRTRRVKLAAFTLSAIPVGMVGGLYFYFVGQIFPQFAFDPLFDVSLALMAFLGGLGTIVGPLLGALVLESLQQYLTQTFSRRHLPDRLRRPLPGRDPGAAAGRRPRDRRLAARRRVNAARARPAASARRRCRAASRERPDEQPDRGPWRLEGLRRRPGAVAV